MSVDLRTRYLGLELRNPLVVSACPLTAKVETLCHLEEAGAAAAVMPLLFEEQIVRDQMELFEYYEDPANSFREALTYFPELGTYEPGPDSYLTTVIGLPLEVFHVSMIRSFNSSWVGVIGSRSNLPRSGRSGQMNA